MKIWLFSVQYFHVVFTIPHQLNDLTFTNKKIMYDILFKATCKTLLELGKDEKYLGALLGFIAILHTWGQNLMFHPHIHCIIPGGGISLDGDRWISCKTNFFIHVNVLSSRFKKNFIKLLKRAYMDDKLDFMGKTECLKEKYVFDSFIGHLLSLKWVVFSKSTFKKPEYVIEYLGRYTNKIAISNHRIISMDDGMVTFKWKDYMDGDKPKVMTISAFEFIRRFLLHVLPNKFVKIRYYGFLSNRYKKEKISLCRMLIAIYSMKKNFKLFEKPERLRSTRCI